MTAQHLNTAHVYTSDMGVEADRAGIVVPTEDYVGLKAATEVFSGAAKNGLYIISAVHNGIPNLSGVEGYLDRVDMGDFIDVLVDGKDAARLIGEMVAERTGKPVGIAKYDGLASLAHSNAQVAMEMAAHDGKSVYLYDEEEDPIEAAIERFKQYEMRN